MEDTRELSLVISNPEQGQFLTRIEWNYDEFKGLVQAAMERYEGVTFTEEQVKEAKEERTRLNALKKAVSDQRIRVKNAVMAPYTQFEAEVREITELIDKPIAEIDRQVREFEDAQKADKKEALRRHFEKAVEGMEFKPTFEQIFDSRYLNVSVSLARAKKDITEKVKRFRFNMENVIEGVDEEHRPIVRDTYLKTLDIALAMSEQNRLKELKRQEEERKAREAERRTAEAREAAIRTAHENAGKAPDTPANPATTESPRNEQPDAQIPTQTTEGNDVSQPAQNPFANPPKEKRYKASFTVVDTMDKILAVKKFMVENGVHFEKGVK